MQLKREHIEGIPIGQIITNKEGSNMLSETLRDIRKKWEEKGKKEGKKEGLLKTATELLKEGLGEDFVRRVTGLPLREIKKLKKDLGLE